jgi:SAM-dependent methyltransferase
MSELEEIKSRYKRRENLPPDRYSILRPEVYLIEQEKERNLIRWINDHNIAPLSNKKLLEIGCGNGSNLLTFIKLGFKPENIVANELLEDRYINAKNRLPQSVEIILGNALDIDLSYSQFDVVYQSMVFSSILDDVFRKELAKKLYELAKPGGGILWYDFIYNNPLNTDVKGIKLREIRNLFKDAKIFYRKLTLAPPISRLVTRIHPNLYYIFNSLYLLRTHLLVWIKKIE